MPASASRRSARSQTYSWIFRGSPRRSRGIVSMSRTNFPAASAARRAGGGAGRDERAVLPVPLGGVHGGVGRRDGGLGGGRRLPERDAADARRHPGQLGGKRRLADEGDELGGVAAHHLLGRLGEDDGELVAAEAGGDVGGATVLAEGAPDDLQHVVAGEVAGGVVHRLEAVEVDEQQAEGAAVPATAGDLLLEGLVEVARVPE